MILRKETFNSSEQGFSFTKTFDTTGRIHSEEKVYSPSKRYEYDKNNHLVFEYQTEHIGSVDIWNQFYRIDYKYENQTIQKFKYKTGYTLSRELNDENGYLISDPPVYEANELVEINEIIFDNSKRKISEKNICLDSSKIYETLYQYSSENLVAIIEKIDGKIDSETLYEYNDQNQISKEISNRGEIKDIIFHIYDNQSHIIESEYSVVTQFFDNKKREIENVLFSKEKGCILKKVKKSYNNNGVDIFLETDNRTNFNISLSDLYELPHYHYDLDFYNYFEKGINNLKISIIENKTKIDRIKVINTENNFLLEEKYFIYEFAYDKNFELIPIFTVGIWRYEDKIEHLFSHTFDYY